MNAVGQVNKSISGINGKTLRIETSDLSNGIYVLELRGGNVKVKERFVVGR